MKVPALAALAPGGPTQTMTGSGGSRSDPTIAWVEARLPPGVSSWMIAADAPSVAARWRPESM